MSKLFDWIFRRNPKRPPVADSARKLVPGPVARPATLQPSAPWPRQGLANPMPSSTRVRDSDNPIVDPLNPLSPINQMKDYETTRGHCSTSHGNSDSGGSWSSSSDSCSTSSNDSESSSSSFD